MYLSRSTINTNVNAESLQQATDYAQEQEGQIRICQKKHLKEAAQLWKNSLDRWNQYGKIQTRRETAESKAYMCHAVIPKQSMRNFCEIPWCKVECLPFNCIIIVWFHVHCGDAQRQNYINHVFVQLSIQEGHRVIFCTFNHFCYL